MRVVRDLIGGNRPAPIDIYYNGDADIDSTTKRYKGSLCKFMDYTGDIDNGSSFVTWAGETTAMENICGILEEEQGTSGNYLTNDATYGMTRRKMTPIFPSTVLEAEYAQADPSGTAIYDTNFSGSAASATLTCGDSITTADTFIGGWIYVINGSAAGFLSYVLNSDASGNLTLDTVLPAAVVAADDILCINPAVGLRLVEFDAHLVNLKSEIDDGARSDYIIGLNTFISAPGISKQYLERNSHDGLIIANARFYHEFIIGGGASGVGNVYAFGQYA